MGADELTTHFIKNKQQLIDNGTTNWNRDARSLLLSLFELGLVSVDPYASVKNHVAIRENKVIFQKKNDEHLEFTINQDTRIFIIGAGKATGRMAQSIEVILGNRITDGIVILPESQLKKENIDLKYIKIYSGGHPIPNEEGFNGAKEIVQISKNISKNDLVICLISGGGSALFSYPADEITLQELKHMNGVLLECGASIDEINTIRKHVSNIKGGKLAKHFFPAQIISLILSDVVGDDLSTIASGLTVGDPTTFNDALEIVKTKNLKDKFPNSIIKHLLKGANKEIEETPKPGDLIFDNVTNITIGSAEVAAKAMHDKIIEEREDIDPILVVNDLHGEAREVGKKIGEIIGGIVRGRESFTFKGEGGYFQDKQITLHMGEKNKNSLLILTGELTVTIHGNGKGGRNQEMLLGCFNAKEFEEVKENFAILSCGMNGIEGNSPAAGGIIDNKTFSTAKTKEMDYKTFLKDNDSYGFFNILGDSIITGPTGTNVNDITLILLERDIKKLAIERVK